MCVIRTVKVVPDAEEKVSFVFTSPWLHCVVECIVSKCNDYPFCFLHFSGKCRGSINNNKNENNKPNPSIFIYNWTFSYNSNNNVTHNSCLVVYVIKYARIRKCTAILLQGFPLFSVPFKLSAIKYVDQKHLSFPQWVIIFEYNKSFWCDLLFCQITMPNFTVNSTSKTGYVRLL